MIQTLINKLIERQDLTEAEAFEAMDSIMSGKVTDAQIGAFLIALRMKGEKAPEIAGFARAMHQKAHPVAIDAPEDTLDIVGTGGDGKHTFNISTVAAFVAAGAGIPVAKHGNRSVSSKCGSADVLRALGVEIDLSPQQMSRCINEVGIGFLFAPRLHPAMKFAIAPRREIGVRTVFNILGPLTNPAGVKRQLIGAYSYEMAKLMVEVFREMGTIHTLVVHSSDGMDEISLAAPTHVFELENGEIDELEIDAVSFGLTPSNFSLAGGDAKTNAQIALEVLSGKKGPHRDVVVMNAAAGIYVAGKAHSFAEAARIAQESIDSGAAMHKLQALGKLTQQMTQN
jgi:anthranilate phosphoribosyltransferase